jgi:acetoin utilization protein AcuB
MYVGRRMSRNVVTVSAGDTLKLAARLMKERRIHHLPVLEGDELAGIVTDSDIRNAALGENSDAGGGKTAAMDRPVGEIMTRDPVTVGPWDTVEDALLILNRRRFGALPVVEGYRLVGIITKADVLAAFIETLCIEGIGVRIEVLVPQDTNAVVRLVQVVGGLGVDMKSLVLSPFRDGFVAFLRLATIDVATVREELRKAGFKIPDLSDFLD